MEDLVVVKDLVKEYESYSIKGMVPMTYFGLYPLFAKLGLKLGSYERTIVRALDGISFRAKEGRILGILGPNASGKTTLLKILAGLTTPTRGEAYVAGLNVIEDHDRLPEVEMFVPGVALVNLFARPDLTVVQNLERFAELAEIKKERVDEIISLVGLEDASRKRVLELSTGQLGRLAVAFGLLREVKVYLMDEPFVGISPEARESLFSFIKELNRERGVTVLYATHILEEAQDFCHEVIILHKGRIIARGEPRELVKRLGLKESVDVEVKLTEDPDSLLKKVRKIKGIEEVFVTEISYQEFPKISFTLITPDSRGVISDLVDLLISGKNKVIYMRVREPSLRDVYMALVKEWEEPKALKVETCLIVTPPR